MRFEFEGTSAELEALGMRLADQLIASRLAEINDSLATIGINQGAIMATLQELFDTVTAEKAQVATKIDALTAQIAALQAQLASGTVVTAEDLDALKAAVEGIFNEPVAP